MKVTTFRESRSYAFTVLYKTFSNNVHRAKHEVRKVKATRVAAVDVARQVVNYTRREAELTPHRVSPAVTAAVQFDTIDKVV